MMEEFSVSNIERDFEGKFNITVFGGKGFQRDGNLFKNFDLSKKFNTRAEAQKYLNRVKREI